VEMPNQGVKNRCGILGVSVAFSLTVLWICLFPTMELEKRKN